jgi:hypothetical protein
MNRPRNVIGLASVATVESRGDDVRPAAEHQRRRLAPRLLSLRHRLLHGVDHDLRAAIGAAQARGRARFIQNDAVAHLVWSRRAAFDPELVEQVMSRRRVLHLAAGVPPLAHGIERVEIVVEHDQGAARAHPGGERVMKFRLRRLLTLVAEQQRLVAVELRRLDLHRLDRHAAHEQRQRLAVKVTEVSVGMVRTEPLEHQRVAHQHAHALCADLFPRHAIRRLFHVAHRGDNLRELGLVLVRNRNPFYVAFRVPVSALRRGVPAFPKCGAARA